MKRERHTYLTLQTVEAARDLDVRFYLLIK